MASAHARASTANGNNTTTASSGQKSYYDQQRELLISEIAQSLEHVLQNVNRLNRSLEEVIQVGNEFAPVESLWSHFESVMGAREGEAEGKKGGAGGGEDGGRREERRSEVGDGDESEA